MTELLHSLTQLFAKKFFRSVFLTGVSRGVDFRAALSLLVPGMNYSANSHRRRIPTRRRFVTIFPGKSEVKEAEIND